MHLRTHWTPLRAEQMPTWGARAWRDEPAIIVVESVATDAAELSFRS